MAAKFIFSVAIALCVFHGATAATTNSTDVIQNILGPILNVVKEFQQRAEELINGLKTNAQNYLSNVTAAFEDLKNRISQSIATLQEKGKGVVTCFTSETQNVSALVQEGEQEAVECGGNITTKAKPYAENFFNVTKEVITLAQALIPGITACVSQANPVTTPICLTTTILPKLADITQVAKDIPAEFDNLKEAVSVLGPQLQTCQALFKATFGKAGSLVQEVEQCVSTVVKG